jgi:multicomponent Na+:H+ antiporter subunit E
VLSGYFDLFYLSLGLISIAIVVLVNSRLRNYNYFNEQTDSGEKIRLFRLIYFILWLLWEIVISSFKVAYLIIHPKMPIKAGIIKFKTNLPHMNAKVILGNSITLTPGTVTIEINDNDFLVHSLTSENIEDHIDHSLAVEVAKLYHVEPGRVVCEEQVITSSKEL